MAEGVFLYPFCGGSYPYADKNVAPQRTINFYPEQIETEDGRVQFSLRPTEGESKIELDYEFNGPCRGLWWSSTGPDGRSCLFGVWGTEFIRIRKLGTGALHAARLGNVGEGTNTCSICDNGFIVLVTDGTTMFGTNLTASDIEARNAYQQVHMPLLGNDGTYEARATFIGYLNQRFVCNAAEGIASSRGCFLFTNEAIDDIANMSWHWDNTAPAELRDTPQYYSAEQNADALLALMVNEGNIYLFGERSFEVWTTNSGQDSYDPFSFVGGSQNQIGVQAPYSVAGIQRFVFWLGGSSGGRNMVFCATGSEPPQRVSTNAIEHIISGKKVRSAAYGFCYARDGHLFYCLTFPDDGTTLVYDLATKMWHERSSHNWKTGDMAPWKVRYATVAFDNMVYFGSSADESGISHLCRLEEDRGTDMDGNPIVRRRVSPVVWDSEKKVYIRDFVIDAEIGTTKYLNDAPNPDIVSDIVCSSDANPTAQLRISRDGGMTWHDSAWRKFGRTGQYTKFLRWKNLGSGRYIAVELTISEKTPIIIAACRISADASLI